MTINKMQDALLNAWLAWHKKARESGAYENPSIPFEQGFKAAWEARQAEIESLQIRLSNAHDDIGYNNKGGEK